MLNCLSVEDTEKRPLSPRSVRYTEKRKLLMEKYIYVGQTSDRLKNRLYHVKKEIKRLKRMKRILCERLLSYDDRFMDHFLEIPDNETGSNVSDQIIEEVASAGALGGGQQGKRRVRPALYNNNNNNNNLNNINNNINNGDNNNQNNNGTINNSNINGTAAVVGVVKATNAVAEFESMATAAKLSISSIIDSVITDTHRERLANTSHNQNNNNNNNSKLTSAAQCSENVASNLTDHQLSDDQSKAKKCNSDQKLEISSKIDGKTEDTQGKAISNSPDLENTKLPFSTMTPSMVDKNEFCHQDMIDIEKTNTPENSVILLN